MNKVKPADVVEVLKSDRHALTELRQRGLAIKTIDFLLRKLTKPEQEIDTERQKIAETQSSETEKIREESKTDNAEAENEETTQKPRRRGRPASAGRKEVKE